ALITSQNRPSVIRVRGNVKIFSTTPPVALLKPITSAAINAATGPLTEIPGTTRDTIHTASALKIQFSSILIFAPRVPHLVKHKPLLARLYQASHACPRA